MKTLEELREFFHCDLGSYLYELEELRKGITKKILHLAIGLSASLLLGTILIFVMKWPVGGFIAVVIITGLIGLLWYHIFIKMSKDTFRFEFKQKIIKTIVQFIDKNLDYSPTRHISQGCYMQSTIFKKSPDRYNGEDYVSGKIGETNIEFSEIHSEYKTQTTDSKGRTSTQWHTIFKGIYFVADFNKDFNGTTVVLPDMAEKMFGFLGKTLQKWNMTRGELINLEDPEFEKQFVVYGDDQIEARYILTTSLMERLMDFYGKVNKITGNEIYLSFTGNKIFVAMANPKNLFEPRLFSSNKDFKLISEYFMYLQLAAGIVKDLKLNNKING